MKNSSSALFLAAGLFTAAVSGCQSAPQPFGLQSRRSAPTPVANNTVQGVVHERSQPDRSVVLEGEESAGGASGWTSLLNPFQKSSPRIPLPLSPKSAAAEDRPDADFN